MYSNNGSTDRLNARPLRHGCGSDLPGALLSVMPGIGRYER